MEHARIAGRRLGNDVVDLALSMTQQKHLDQRFLQRVFTMDERCAIQQALDKNRLLWSIWAAKEAAYKAYKKQFPACIFAHRKFALTAETLRMLLQAESLAGLQELTGILVCEDLALAIKWQWGKSMVHCMGILASSAALFQDWQMINWQVHTLDATATMPLKTAGAAKNFSCRELASIFSAESLQTRLHAKRFLQTLGFSRKVEIIRTTLATRLNQQSPPALYLGKNILIDHEVSLSHDGQWGAVAVLSPTDR
jgi:phosphopantetheinyl transferase (holo-ACP synthase)